MNLSTVPMTTDLKTEISNEGLPTQASIGLSTTNIIPALSAASEPTVFTPRKEESQKVTLLPDQSDEKENTHATDTRSKLSDSNRPNRRFRRSEQDPIVAPGFGTARDIRRLAAQLSEGNEIQITPEVVEVVMNAKGQGLPSSSRSSRRSNNNAAEQVTSTTSSAWADFMKEEGVIADADSATKPSASTSADRKRSQDSNDTNNKKKKVVATEDENIDLLVQHHGVLLQAGTLDTAAVGRIKGGMKNPPAYNLNVPTKILPKVIVRSVHTSSNSCHAIAISDNGVSNTCHHVL
jgi:hypothetical protein